MGFLSDIYTSATMNADYLVLMSVLVGIWAIGLFMDKRSSISNRVVAAVLSILALYFARVISVAIQVDKIEPTSFWTGFALVLNTTALFFTGLFSVLVLRRNSDDRPGEEEVDTGRGHARRFFLYSVYSALGGAVFYLALCLAFGTGFDSVQLVSFACLAAATGIFAMWVPSISFTKGGIRRAVIFSSIIFSLGWALFHYMHAFAGRITPELLGVSRSFDLVLVLSLLSGFQKRRVQERLRYRSKAEQSLEEAERTRDELARLHELTTQMLEDNSELIKKLKGQSRQFLRKAESLEKALTMGLAIQKKRDLKELLQMIVELVRENLGFKTVILRLLTEKSQSFESKAYVGLSDEVKDTVINYRIPRSEFEKMIEPRFKISKSYFIRNSSPWYGEDVDGDEKMLVDDTWREIDMLIVPLVDEDEDKLIGYLSVEDPGHIDTPVADVIENLESMAALAVSAINNAKLFKELEEKNEKLKIYMEKLESLNKMKSDFVATISHEFKTPLTSIKAYCEALIRNADKIDRKIIKEFLGVIDQESDRLMSLIDDILNFSQMESGAIKFKRTNCSLIDTLKEAVNEMGRRFSSKNIDLELVLPPKDVKIRADRGQIKQLLLNLLDNAFKFTEEGGRVKVRLEDETVSARITVEDNGIGVPEDQMEKIFEHFHQADGSSTRRHGGSGLGLALCKNIVEWHDGRIWVENVEGGGARFVAIIPKKQAIVRTKAMDLSGPASRFEVERYLELLIEMVAELLLVKRASLMLFDMSRTELKIESAVGIGEEIVESARVKVGDSISGRVVQEGETLLVEDIERDPRTIRNNNGIAYESKSFLSVPVRIKGEVVGVVNVANPIKKDKFDEEDKNLLEFFVERVSHALQKLEEYTNVSEDFARIRKTMKSILDTKRYIDVQSEFDLSRLVAKTAEKLGLSEEEKAVLQYALNIYDVGLLETGCNIIKKPSELTDEDWLKIENHTISGIEMLNTIEGMPKVKDIVLYHHENYDGTGYPGRLSGKTIPIGARIIRVADSFRALTSRRPYQKRYSIDEATEVLKHRANTFFDPDVVAAFVEAMGECRAEESTGVQTDRENKDTEVTVSATGKVANAKEG